MQYKKGFIDLIIAGVIGAIFVAGSILGYLQVRKQAPVQQPVTQSFGAFNTTGGGTYRLQSSISTTQTTITLTSFKEPISNIKYTMAYLNSSVEYGTIDPQNNSSKEFVSFTGITQNADNTATLTGVTRGLGFSYPYTASTTLQSSHSGQSIFILSNPPQLTNQYSAKANDEAITGLWNFNSYLPTSSITATSSNQFAIKSYVDGVAIAGAPTAQEGVTGIVRLSTQLQMASSTFSAGTPTVLYSLYATSSPYTTGLWIPISLNSGKLSPSWLNGTNEIYTFNSLNIASSTIASSTIYTLNAGTINATSSISINGVKLVTIPIPIQDTGSYTTSNTSTTTLATEVIPAGTIGINGTINVTAFMTSVGSNAHHYMYINFGNGTATTTIGTVFADVSAYGNPATPYLANPTGGGFIQASIRNLNSASSQLSFGVGTTGGLTSTFSTIPINSFSISTTTSINTTAQTYISVSAATPNGSDSVTVKGITVTFIP